MEHQFWKDRWELNQIGFHQTEINTYLSQHWSELGLLDNAPVFVPLCGKSLDMLWLREQGHDVLGIELFEVALDAFFSENDIIPTKERTERFVEFKADHLRLLAGDFFHLQAEDLDGINAVYDRAALIAFPPEMRAQYANHMSQLLKPGAHIMLIAMEYKDGVLKGPPFSVNEAEVHQLYAEHFDIQLKGAFDRAWVKDRYVTEKVYSLTRRP